MKEEQNLLIAARLYADAMYRVQIGQVGWEEQLASAQHAMIRLSAAAITYGDALVIEKNEVCD